MFGKHLGPWNLERSEKLRDKETVEFDETSKNASQEVIIKQRSFIVF